MSWSPAGPAWLFCPGDRPERFGKAASRADVVILDLEDAVAPDRKAAAREALRQVLRRFVHVPQHLACRPAPGTARPPVAPGSAR